MPPVDSRKFFFFIATYLQYITGPNRLRPVNSLSQPTLVRTGYKTAKRRKKTIGPVLIPVWSGFSRFGIREDWSQSRSSPGPKKPDQNRDFQHYTESSRSHLLCDSRFRQALADISKSDSRHHLWMQNCHQDELVCEFLLNSIKYCLIMSFQLFIMFYVGMATSLGLVVEVRWFCDH